MFNLDVIQNGLIAECWIPIANLEDVQLALRRGTVSNSVAHYSLIHSCFIILQYVEKVRWLVTCLFLLRAPVQSLASEMFMT